MGVISTIIRSDDDLIKPKKKNYWGYNLTIDLVDVETIRQKEILLPSEKRALMHELSGKEPIEKAIVINTKDASLGRLTTSQLKDMFDDMGFNVDVTLSKSFHSDTSAVMNINGYIIPGWKFIVKLIKKLKPEWEKRLLLKLAPGKERLHVRFYEMNDGSWLIAAHTDMNWMTLNPFRIFNSHVKEGAGNYDLGTTMLYNILIEFNDALRNNQNLSTNKIISIVRNTYYKQVFGSISFVFSL